MSPARTDLFDLAPLRLRAGEGRRLELAVPIDTFELGAERYDVSPSPVPVVLDVSRMTGGGTSLRLRFTAELDGPCMRCLEPAAPAFEIDAREVDQPGEGPELDSPYVDGEVVDVGAWARDALALTLPQQVLCTPECAGLCAVCGENLNTAGPEHHHERERDPRWAKLDELRFD
jgi:uncharacterized protein